MSNLHEDGNREMVASVEQHAATGTTSKIPAQTRGSGYADRGHGRNHVSHAQASLGLPVEISLRVHLLRRVGTREWGFTSVSVGCFSLVSL